MMDFQNIKRDELDSAHFDGENFTKDDLDLSKESIDHMQNWSMIGATLRNEAPSDANLDFASSVMAQIKSENITPDVVDQAEVSQTTNVTLKSIFKKFSYGVAQMAVAASVAAVTIIGYQTFKAQGNTVSENTTAVNFGSLGSANLASYQSNQDPASIQLNQKATVVKEKASTVKSAEIKKQQELEVERINNYIRGYVFDTAAW